MTFVSFVCFCSRTHTFLDGFSQWSWVDILACAATTDSVLGPEIGDICRSFDVIFTSGSSPCWLIVILIWTDERSCFKLDADSLFN